MFVRVFDKEKNAFFKSMVYAIIGTGWFEQHIVLNPHTNTFDLVEYLDKNTEPAKPFIEIIQNDTADFVACTSNQMQQYDQLFEANNYQKPYEKQLKGYADIVDNYAFLADILKNKSVCADAYNIPVRHPDDVSEWSYILTQADADDFMQKFEGFHDSTLDKISYSDNFKTTSANAIFDNSGWFGIAELCFEGVQMLKIIPATENYSNELLCASLIVENECIFWADTIMEKPDLTYEGTIIKALSLKWRKL